MTSDAQRKRGWTIPEVIETDERVCVQFEIPNTPEYRQATYGTISRLQEWFNWEKTWDEGDTRASQVAHYMRQILFNTLTMTDDNCGVTTMFMLRQNPSDSCELQQSLDGGQTWSTAFDFSLCDIGGASVTNINISVAQTYIQDLRTIYDIDINLIGEKLGNNDEWTDIAICHALELLVRGSLAGALERLRSDNNQELVIQAVAGGVAIAGAFIFGTPLSGMATGIGVAVGLIATAIMNEFDEQELEDILNNDIVIDELRCCAYGATVGTKPTVTSFATIFDNCTNMSPEAVSVLPILQEVVGNFDTFLTFLEGANQAYEYAERGVLGNECDNCDEWCYEWLGGSGFDPAWSEVPQTGYTPATYDAFGDKTIGGFKSNALMLNVWEIPVIGDITSITVRHEYNVTRSTSSDGVRIFIDGVAKKIEGITGAPQGVQVVEWSGAEMATTNIMVRTGAGVTATIQDAYTWCTSIIIRGIGDNPFGIDNCDT